EDPGGAANDAGTCPAVVGPAPHDRDVSRSAELELDVRGSRGIGVAQHPPVAPHHSRGGDTVAVPVADDRDVPGASELEREFRLAGTFHLADVPGEGFVSGGASSGAPNDRRGPDTGSREVGHQEDVTGQPVLVGRLRGPSAERVPQLPRRAGHDSGPGGGGPGGVETRGSVVPGRLGPRVGPGAGRAPLPRRPAGDGPAHEGPEAGDVLVALAVAEAGAARLPVAAVPVGAGAVAVDAFVAAGSGAPAAAAVTV